MAPSRSAQRRPSSPTRRTTPKPEPRRELVLRGITVQVALAVKVEGTPELEAGPPQPMQTFLTVDELESWLPNLRADLKRASKEA